MKPGIRTTHGEYVSDYRWYLNTTHWRELRESVLNERGHECECCYSTDGLQVHHLTYERVGHEDFADLVVLCDSCHGDAHDTIAERRGTRRPQSEPVDATTLGLEWLDSIDHLWRRRA